MARSAGGNVTLVFWPPKKVRKEWWKERKRRRRRSHQKCKYIMGEGPGLEPVGGWGVWVGSFLE